MLVLTVPEIVDGAPLRLVRVAEENLDLNLAYL